MLAPLSFHALARASVVAVAVGGPLVEGCGGVAARPTQTPDVVVLNDNGAWSWFEDERAVVDAAAGKLLVSSVASGSGTGGASRDGNVELVAYDLATGETERAVLHPALQADDHNSAALYVRPDGRYVAMYSRHATDRLSRWRITDRPADVTAWGPETTLDHGVPVTYSNLYPADGGRLFGFTRATGRDPNVVVSDDGGTTWRHGGRLLDGPGRPYVRYASDGAGRIHLVTTDQHPADYANRIYHGVVVDGRLVRSDGSVVDGDVSDPHAVAPRRLTEVHSGIDRDHAWTIDLAVDDRGRPSTVFSVSTEPGTARQLATGVAATHRYYYARHDGTAWSVHFLAHAGRALYRDEPFYTGLVALHPNDPHHVFVSTDVHPATGRPLVSAADGRRHHELFEGETADGGATWRWRPITADSTADNIRPIVPTWNPSHTALLWLRGTYTTYQDYDLDVVGSITSDAVE